MPLHVASQMDGGHASDDVLSERAAAVHERLRQAYGEPDRPALDPIAELCSTILSQNTNDRNRDLAFDRLQARFPSWEAVRDAPIEEIEAAIRPAGLAQAKARHMKAALEHITRERGELNLCFLRDMPVAEAKAWLTSMNGVGPKTAAIVLLFALDMRAFPVDTHVHRVSQRLGLIGAKTTREQAHHILESLVRPDIYYPFHIELIQHGRQVGRAGQPRCEACVLTDLCDYFQKQRVAERASEPGRENVRRHEGS